MAAPRPDSPEQMAPRLRLIRIAYGRLQGRVDPEIGQAEFARLCGISAPTWNNAETGDNRLGIDNAMAVSRRTGATLDYIFFGERRGLPLDLALQIEKLADPAAKSAISPGSKS